MLEETDTNSAPHKPLRVGVYVCVRTRMHTQTHTMHTKEKTANTEGGSFDFPKRGLLCQYPIILLWNSRCLILVFTSRPLLWCSPYPHMDQETTHY